VPVEIAFPCRSHVLHRLVKHPNSGTRGKAGDAWNKIGKVEKIEGIDSPETIELSAHCRPQIVSANEQAGGKNGALEHIERKIGRLFCNVEHDTITLGPAPDRFIDRGHHLRIFRRQQAPLRTARASESDPCNSLPHTPGGRERTAAGSFTTTTSQNGRLVRTIGSSKCAFVQASIGLFHSFLTRSSGLGVFGYGTGAGGRNELCRDSVVSCAFVELCSIQKAITCIYVPTRTRVGGTESPRSLLLEMV
jgi:hypothetical protein